MPTGRYKFLTKDKIDIFHWETRRASVSISRIVLHEDTGDTEETADVALIYSSASPQGSAFAQWGLARQDGPILLWRCSDGADMGMFADVPSALQVVEQHAATLLEGGAPVPPLSVVSNS